MSREPAFGAPVGFTELSCGECGIVFYVPHHWYRARQEKGENGGRFSCPNGHGRVFSEPEIDKVRRELDRAKQENARLAEEAAAAERARAREAAARKREMKRHVAGLCPECNRSFANLARHVRNQHPEHASNVLGRKVEPEKRPNLAAELAIDGLRKRQAAGNA